MHHPDLLLIPLLMLSDYALTVAGARARERAYAEHFHTAHYELNPLWQRDIAAKRWFNPRHLALTFCIALVFYVAGEVLMPTEDPVLDIVAGALLVLFGAVNGRHLSNLAIFACIDRHPGELHGRIEMSHRLTLWLSTFQLLGLLLPLALLVLVAPTPHLFGGLLGASLLLSIHLGWIRRWSQRNRASSAPPPSTT